MSADIRDIALRKLSDRARTENEIRRFLKEKGFEEDKIDDTIEFLKEYNYIDDKAYCKEFYVYSVKKGKGRIRIEHELSEKGVDFSLIKESLDEITEDPELNLGDERARALDIGIKMLKTQLDEGKEKDNRFFAKLGRRLVTLGYGTDTAYYVIEKLKNYEG